MTKGIGARLRRRGRAVLRPILEKTEQTISSLHFLTNRRGSVKEALMCPYKASMLSDSARHETDDATSDKKKGGKRCALRLSLVFGFRSGRALVWRDFPFFSFSAWPRFRELGSRVLLSLNAMTLCCVEQDIGVGFSVIPIGPIRAGWLPVGNGNERSLEVICIYRGLVDEDSTRPESQFAFYLDEPALVTLGVCYERVPRFGGGAYHSILRRLETFTDDPLRAALKDHEKAASQVLDLEEKVAAAVKKLKERGLVSPYLRAFVVARINPLRWIKG